MAPVADARNDDVSRRKPYGLVVSTGLIVAFLYACADRVMEDVLEIGSVLGEAAEVGLMGVVTAAVLWVGVMRSLYRQVEADRRIAGQRQAELVDAARREEFDSRMHRALEMADTEAAVHATTRKALSLIDPDLHAELLLADSSDAHLKRAMAVGEGGPACCDVGSPSGCPAVRRSQTLAFSSGDALDACPHLDGRPGGTVSAVCVPVSVGGRSIGVLHTASAPPTPAQPGDVSRLESVATQIGSRIGMLRVMSATSLQASTDPLTGLLNRRALEDQVHRLVRMHRPYALAMGDLDHFKRLNDTNGHEAGDRALRLFARTLLASLRTDDLVCRYGGEEFVVVFPNCSADVAADALERSRADLLGAIANGSVPGFTVSFGVAHSDDASSFEDLVRAADAALFRAKREGRDRVVVDAPVSGGASATAERPSPAADAFPAADPPHALAPCRQRPGREGADGQTSSP